MNLTIYNLQAEDFKKELNAQIVNRKLCSNNLQAKANVMQISK